MAHEIQRGHEEPRLQHGARRAAEEKSHGTTVLIRQMSGGKFHNGRYFDITLLRQILDQFLHGGGKTVDVAASGSSHPRLTATTALYLFGG